MNNNTKLFLEELYNKGLRFLARDAADNTLAAYYERPILQEENYYESPDEDFWGLSADSIENFVYMNDLEPRINHNKVNFDFVKAGATPIKIKTLLS